MTLWPFATSEQIRAVAASIAELRAALAQQRVTLDFIRGRVVELSSISKDVEAMRRLVGDIYRVLVYPQVRITGEASMPNTMIFAVDLPPVKDADTVSRRLKVTIGGEEQVVDVTKDQTVVEGLKGPQDSTVVIVLEDVDDADNASAYPTVTVELKDTIPPAIEGAPGVRLTGEE